LFDKRGRIAQPTLLVVPNIKDESNRFQTWTQHT
jgi:hypothetical protein